MPFAILTVLQTSDCQAINVGGPKLALTIYLNNSHRTRFGRILTTAFMPTPYGVSVSLPFLYNSTTINQGPALNLKILIFKAIFCVHVLGL